MPGLPLSVLRRGELHFRSLSFNLGFQNVGLIRLADVGQLARDLDRLCCNPGKLGPQLDKLCGGQGLVVKYPDSIQHFVALRVGPGAGAFGAGTSPRKSTASSVPSSA